MVGPTAQGTDDLIAKDPDAYWDNGCNCVQGQRVWPRARASPSSRSTTRCITKTASRTGATADLKIANYLGVFIERVQGNEVIGRITPGRRRHEGRRGPGAGGRVSHGHSAGSVTTVMAQLLALVVSRR